MILPICIAFSILQATDTPSDPAFQLATKLAGGNWEGHVGKKVKVRFTFTLEEHGTKLVGRGLIMPNGKEPTTVLTTLGWDPKPKETYYLDMHGHDTVYFGHVTRDGDNLVFDFNGLVGDEGHYRAVESFPSGSDYRSTMSYEEKGKWVDMGFHLALHRSKIGS